MTEKDELIASLQKQLKLTKLALFDERQLRLMNEESLYYARGDMKHLEARLTKSLAEQLRLKKEIEELMEKLALLEDATMVYRITGAGYDR